MKSVHNKNIILPKTVKDFLNSYSYQFLPKETGGILLGFEDDNSIYITHATKAGPNSKHHKYRFMRDQKYCKSELDRIYIETSGHCDYIGEWHSHPFNCSISPLDMLSLLSLSLNPLNNVNNPLLLINVIEYNLWRKDIFVCNGFKIKNLTTIY